MLGLYDKFSPKFVKKYAHLAGDMKKAFRDYIKDIKERNFPKDEHSFH
jgi:3-methyl-2-oxobutanoate hydroxymethyltransferase